MQQQRWDIGEALIKARTFCNYRDRCHKEVRDKLYKMGLWKKDVEQVITTLIDEDLLNEERYTRSFIRGYFYTKRWGKRKISYALKQNQIHDRLIARCMDEINDEDYQATIRHLIEKKWSMLKKGTMLERRQKVANYLLQKGFDYRDFKPLLDEYKV